MYFYHRATLIELLRTVLAHVETQPAGLDKQAAVAFIRCLRGYANGALAEMEIVVREHRDDGPIEVSADLVDRLLKAMLSSSEGE